MHCANAVPQIINHSIFVSYLHYYVGLSNLLNAKLKNFLNETDLFSLAAMTRMLIWTRSCDADDTSRDVIVVIVTCDDVVSVASSRPSSKMIMLSKREIQNVS